MKWWLGKYPVLIECDDCGRTVLYLWTKWVTGFDMCGGCKKKLEWHTSIRQDTMWPGSQREIGKLLDEGIILKLMLQASKKTQIIFVNGQVFVNGESFGQEGGDYTLAVIKKAIDKAFETKITI